MRAADLPGRSRTPTVAGTDSPTAWGHRFGAGLCCDWCGTTWGAHEAKPRPCVRTPGEHPDRGRSRDALTALAGAASSPRIPAMDLRDSPRSRCPTSAPRRGAWAISGAIDV